jgi:hypothetical protein
MATKTREEKEEKTGSAKYPDEILEASEDYKRYFEEKLADVDFDIKLYRFSGDKFQNKQRKTFLKKFVNEIPEEDAIGYSYGGGHFYAMGWNPVTEKLYTKHIFIDEAYTELKKTRDSAQENKLVAFPAPPPPAQNIDPIALMKEFFNMVTPMMEAVASSKNDNNNKNNTGMDILIPKVITGAADIFTGAFKKMSDSFIRAQQELMDSRMEPEEPEPGPDDPQTKIVNGIIDFIKGFADRIINAPQKQVEGMINDPGLQRILNDKDMLSMVYSSCAGDKTIGKKKIDKIFTKLGVEVPA